MSGPVFLHSRSPGGWHRHPKREAGTTVWSAPTGWAIGSRQPCSARIFR